MHPRRFAHDKQHLHDKIRNSMSLIIPNEKKSLGKRRHGMPQISDYDAFLADLEKAGVAVVTISIPANELIPTQGEFNEAKVRGMIDAGKWDSKPIVSSDDDYILDGHHRWLAAAQLKKSVKSRVVDMNIDALLKFVKGKPYVTTKKLHEAVTGELAQVQNYFAKVARTGGTQFAEVLNRFIGVREKIQDRKDLAVQQKTAILKLLDRIDGLVTS